MFSLSWQGLFLDGNTGFHWLNPPFVCEASRVVSAVALYTCCCVSCHPPSGYRLPQGGIFICLLTSLPLLIASRLHSTTRKCLIGKRRSVCMCVWMHAFVSELESMFSSLCVYVCVCMCWTDIHSSFVHDAHSLSIPSLLTECNYSNLTMNTPSQQPIRTINYAIFTLWWLSPRD